MIAEEMCKGDQTQTDKDSNKKELHPFQWHCVHLNLSGPGYNPSLSWVAKLQEDGYIACNLFTYEDNERITGPTKEL